MRLEPVGGVAVPLVGGLAHQRTGLAGVGRRAHAVGQELGQVPLRPSDLASPSVSKVDVTSLLDRLSGAPLDDLAADAGLSALADRLETLVSQ